MDNIAVFLAYHIHMGLQNNPLMVLITGCRGHAHDDIHRLIGDTLYAVFRCERLQPPADLLLMLGRTRHFAYLRKDVKDFILHNF